MAGVSGVGKVRSDFSNIPEGFKVPTGDAERGHRMFKKHCSQCHSVYPDNRITRGGATQIGPTLFNVYGRASGEAEIASKDILPRATGLIWDDGALMKYMQNPRQATQHNIQMNFRGIEDWQTRVDIVHYLKTLNWENPIYKEVEDKPPSFANVFPFNVLYHVAAGK